MSKNDKSAIHNAAEIIERFGGIRPMAAKISTPVTTVQGWKKRDVIPSSRREQIIKAAKENNIDISDLEAGAANTNAAKQETVAPTVTTHKAEKTPPAPEAVHEEKARPEAEIKATPKPTPRTERDERAPASPFAASKPNTQHDKLLAAMEANSRRAMVNSAWIATGLILLACGVAAVLLLPDNKTKKEEMEAQSQKLAALEAEMKTKEESNQGFMGNILPGNIQEKMDRLQNQARNIQITVDQLSERADQISSEFSSSMLGPDAGPISQRLDMIEEKISQLTGNSSMSGLVERIKRLEETAGGQLQLQESFAELKTMIDREEDQNLDENLAEAQGEKQSALGQTLQGVSGTDLKAAAMLVAFSQLRGALHRQEPFEEDLKLLQGLVDEDNVELQETLVKLSPHADDGVLTATGLSKELRGLTGDIVASSLKGEDVSVKEKAMARINNIMQVEKDGEPITGTDTQKTVAQAQKLLDEGNIQDAITTLKTLDGQAGQEAAPLIEKAEISLMAEKVQQMLGQTILSKIKGPGSITDKASSLTDGSTGVDLNNPALNLPLTSSITLDEIKDNLGDTIPTLNENKVIKDEASGVTILPTDQGFKGFSNRKE